jgi:valyl-tRNA synthetase
LAKEYDSVQGRLNNPHYLAKAPAEVVAKEQVRAQELQGNMEKLRGQWGKLS